MTEQSLKSKQGNISRRQALGCGVGLGFASAGAALPSPALAQGLVEWTMVTSWPRNLPGPGQTANRIAESIALASNGRLSIKLNAAGELVPAFEVFDAVSGGTAQMAHTASLFWSGKISVAPLFTASPFGLTPLEHIAWIDHGGGQALWDEFYAPFNLKPFMAGNTGFQMGGWYRKEITTLDDMVGLKIRMPGLGGEVVRQLGATPVSMPPGEIFSALQSGVIDAAEFLGPFSDTALALYDVAPFYYWPGFHEPNGTGEALIAKPAWDALPSDLKEIVVAVLARENIRSLGEAEWMNGAALDALVKEKDTQLRSFPDDVMVAARKASDVVFDKLASGGEAEARLIESYLTARRRLSSWSTISQAAFLQARGEA